MPVFRATFDVALILKPALLLRLPFLVHHHWAYVGDQCGRDVDEIGIFILRSVLPHTDERTKCPRLSRRDPDAQVSATFNCS